MMTRKDPISPYLERPLRSLEEVLRARAGRLRQPRQDCREAPAADNSNGSLPPAKSA